MKIQTSSIVSGKYKDSKRLDIIAKNPNSKDSRVVNNKDIKNDISRILIKHNLSIEDIVIKYKEIYDGRLAGTKVSDVVNVLASLEKLHGLHSKSENIDEITLTLSSKSPEELEAYLTETLEKTRTILARLQARRINKHSSG